MRFFDESIPKFVPALKRLIFQGISLTEWKNVYWKTSEKNIYPKFLDFGYFSLQEG